MVNRTTFNLVLLFSIFALLFAYYVQYTLGHQPCNLCLIERIPYLLIIIIVILSFLLKKYEKLYLFLLSLIFISATLISLYHIGIEQGFIEESLVCELNSKTINLTTQDILSELKEKTISCKEVNFRIMGLSLATINTIISFVLSIIMGKLFFNYGKNK